ncbi:MAG TPA: terminase gpA endonuclease subunit [Ramlibacter sp.]|nr:terminase gpA endonuclease subunit [Ramlibacter sp.]
MGARDLDSLIAEPLPETLAAIRRALRAGMAPLKVEAAVRGSEWATKHFYLSAESSQGQQRWTCWPFQVAVLDWMVDDRIAELDVPKAKRVGYTKMLLSTIAYNAAQRRRNQAIWQPTDDDSDDFCKTELEPMLRDVDIMRRVFPEFMAKSKANTLQHKKFLGSILHLRGGKAAKNYRRITVSVALIDEADGFDQEIEKSADPVTLAHGRLEGATFPKLIVGSTPRIKGFSHVERRALQADAFMRWHITCPHCDLEHPLKWGGKDKPWGMKWEPGQPETVHHVCPHCRGKITQADYFKLWHAGKWISDCGNYSWTMDGVWRDGAGQPCRPPLKVACHIWTAMSPQATWSDLVTQFLNAKRVAKAGDKGPLKGFVNEVLGETWEDDEAEKFEGHELAKRKEPYKLRVVPKGGVSLTAGVDVQDTYFAINIVAWGKGMESWQVDRVRLTANPADERDWDKLHAYLQTELKHQFGAPMRVEAAAIDTGGHFTHQAYAFVMKYGARFRYFAIKGESRDGKPIKGSSALQDVNFNGRILRNGVRLWFVGTDTAKDLIFGRLRLTSRGPGCMHFSEELPDEFYQQLTAEKRVPVKTHRGDVYRWVKMPGHRNEDLDGNVYALFAAHALDLDKRPDRMWDRLDQNLEPDLFDVSEPVPPEDNSGGAAPAAPAVITEAAPAAQPKKTATPLPKTKASVPASSLASSEWSERL